MRQQLLPNANSAEPDLRSDSAPDSVPPQRKFILEAIKRRASDIHVIPGDGAGRISIRTDGVVSYLITEIPAARMENLANAFSDMAGVNGYELMQRSKGAEINITVRTNAGRENV